MKHFASSGFWSHFAKLPTEIQALARESFDRLKANPRHPSLHFKKAGTYWSARVGRGHRALGKETEGGILWVWIGTHAEYDKLLS